MLKCTQMAEGAWMFLSNSAIYPFPGSGPVSRRKGAAGSRRAWLPRAPFSCAEDAADASACSMGDSTVCPLAACTVTRTASQSDLGRRTPACPALGSVHCQVSPPDVSATCSPSAP